MRGDSLLDTSGRSRKTRWSALIDRSLKLTMQRASPENEGPFQRSNVRTKPWQMTATSRYVPAREAQAAAVTKTYCGPPVADMQTVEDDLLALRHGSRLSTANGPAPPSTSATRHAR